MEFDIVKLSSRIGVALLSASAMFVAVMAIDSCQRERSSGVSIGPTIVDQPVLPPVDYSIDRNRLSCILNRVEPQIVEFCESQFER